MNIVQLVCPACGATLDVDDELELFYCKYCGSKLIAENLDKGRLDAKLKLYEMQQNERMQQSEYEYQQQLRQEEHKQERFRMILGSFGDSLLPFIIIMVMLAFLLLGVMVPSRSERNHDELVARLEALETEIQTDIESGNYDEALLKTKRLVLDDNWSSKEEKTWASKRNEYEELIEAKIKERDANDPDFMYAPKSSKDFKKMTGQKALELLESVGFTNVSLVKVPDDSGFFIFGKKTGKVESVNFGGLTDFTTSDSCRLDEKIVVYYYADE